MIDVIEAEALGLAEMTPVKHNAPALQGSREVAAAAPQAGPMGSALAFIQAGGTIEQVRDMLALQRDWEASEARKAFVADMAEFKKSPPTITKDKLVAYTGTSYMHATLGNVTGAIVEGLARNGFSHRWDTVQDGPQIIVACILTHKLGHSERTTLSAGKDDSGKKNDIQKMASTITYLQRYTLLAATGIATNDQGDDDGRASGRGDTFYVSADAVQEWTDKANAALSTIALSETWKMAGAEFNAAKDIDGWNAFKVVASAKRATLTTGATA